MRYAFPRHPMNEPIGVEPDRKGDLILMKCHDIQVLQVWDREQLKELIKLLEDAAEILGWEEEKKG